MELASVYASFGSLPGIRPDILQRVLGFEFHLCRPNELPERRPRWQAMDLYRGLRFWLEMAGMTSTLAKKAQDWLHENRAHSFVNTVASWETQTEAILEHIDWLLPRTAKIFGLHLQCTAMAFSALGLLEQLARKYAEPDEVQTFESGLMADFQAMSTVQQIIAIWDLAQEVKRVPQATKALFEMESHDEIIEAWRSSPEKPDLLMLWDSFIDRFGDRGTDEFELSAARWDEDPSFVLQAMREALEQQSPDPRERLERRQAVGQQHTQRMLERIAARGSTWEVRLFRRLVVAYQRNTLLRENLKHSLVTRFNALRKAFIALGEFLEQTAVIASCDDVFFLRHEEIIEAIENLAQPSFNANSLVARRKKEHTKWISSTAFDVWVSMDGQEHPMKLPSWDYAATLQGIGCSPGQVAGTARVVTSLQDSVPLGPDQILVVHSIDPGWTPLFLAVGGLVTEIGGVLSHGATVAREYGLPAVVGVPDATKKIQNGQQITVDGFTGLVYLGAIEQA
jgi:pyruvate,water dikinase